MTSSRFVWYDRVEPGISTIEQGDILHNCRIFSLPLDNLYDQIQRLDPALASQELQIDTAPLEQVNLICDLQTQGTMARRRSKKSSSVLSTVTIGFRKKATASST